MTGSESGFILNPGELASRIVDWQKKGFHVLSPAIQVATFAPGYGVNASLVLLDHRPEEDGGAGDVYFDKNTMQKHERAPSKIGLMKIAAATGVSWVKPYGRVDPLTIKNLWIFEVTGVYLAYDGTPQTIKGIKEIDYRDESAAIGEWSREAWDRLVASSRQDARLQINGWTDRRVMQARCNGSERAETGALERAIRTLGVKHTYTVDELMRPFVALRVCPVIDMSDPAVREMVAQHQLGGVASLYAPTVSRQALPEPSRDWRFEAPQQPRQPVYAPAARTIDMAPDTPRTTEPPATETRHSEPAREPAADQDEPAERTLPPGAVYIQNCRREEIPYSKQHAKHGQTFDKWTVTDSNGEAFTTIYKKWGDVAQRCYENGIPVFIEASEINKYREREILNIREAGPAATRTRAAASDRAAMQL